MEGLGIAYGPKAFFRDQVAAGQLRRVLGYYTLPRVSVYSLFVRGRFVPAKIEAFNAFMQQFLVGRIS